MNKRSYLAVLMTILTVIAPTTLTAQALDDKVKGFLLEALEDERKAQAFYDSVMDIHGDILPFRNIVRAESNHERALLNAMARYGVQAPTNNVRMDAPYSLDLAFRMAIQSEIDNRAMYQRMISQTPQSDLRMVFENLGWASEERHLPAFRYFLSMHLNGGAFDVLSQPNTGRFMDQGPQRGGQRGQRRQRRGWRWQGNR